MKTTTRRVMALGAMLLGTCAMALSANAGGSGTQLTVAGQLRPNDLLSEFISAQPARVSALNGDTAALVIHKAEAAGTVSILHGQVYIYQRALGVWSVQAILTPSDPADSIYYGRSISLQGDTLVVGVGNPPPAVGFSAPPTNPTTIRGAYVYQRQGGGWVEKARLVGSDALATTYDFGADVAVSGSTITVGATGGLRQYCTQTCETLERRAGATFVFDQDPTGSWIQTARIATSSQVGGLAAFSGNTLAVPEIQSLTNGRFIGRVAVYRRAAGVWTREALLTAADQTPASALLSSTPPSVTRGLFYSGFIATPAVDGDTILVGGAETTTKDIRGTVYIFKRSATGWAQQAKIIPKNSKPYDGFGASLSLSGNGALVGSFQPQPSLLVRTGSTWTETPIQSPGVEVRKHVDMFGRSVAIDRNTALITQPYQRAMVYAITPAP